ALAPAPATMIETLRTPMPCTMTALATSSARSRPVRQLTSLRHTSSTAEPGADPWLSVREQHSTAVPTIEKTSEDVLRCKSDAADRNSPPRATPLERQGSGGLAVLSPLPLRLWNGPLVPTTVAVIGALSGTLGSLDRPAVASMLREGPPGAKSRSGMAGVP